MSSAMGGVGPLAVGAKEYKRREQQLLTDDLNVDMEGRDYKDHAIRLQFTNDEIEAFPSCPRGTVAMSSAETLGGTTSNVSPLESPHDILPLGSPYSAAKRAATPSPPNLT